MQRSRVRVYIGRIQNVVYHNNVERACNMQRNRVISVGGGAFHGRMFLQQGTLSGKKCIKWRPGSFYGVLFLIL